MRVTQEAVTVLANPVAGEINIILGGLRITLSADESALLAGGLVNGLEQLRAMAKAEAAMPETWGVGRADEAEAMQQRTRALIQATIRDKGLSLRDGPAE